MANADRGRVRILFEVRSTLFKPVLDRNVAGAITEIRFLLSSTNCKLGSNDRGSSFLILLAVASFSVFMSWITFIMSVNFVSNCSYDAAAAADDSATLRRAAGSASSLLSGHSTFGSGTEADWGDPM